MRAAEIAAAVRERAAAAQLAQADFDATVPARADSGARSLSRRAFSRRALFHPATMLLAGETPATPLPLREPGASARAVDIAVDAGRCSACGCCATACPTGALTAGHQNGQALLLSADTARCTACGACVRACPEDAVSVRRAADSVSLATGRRVVASITAGARCESCGQLLSGGLSGEAVALRLAASHPQVASRLRHESRCTDCLLKAPKTAASGSRPPGPAP